MSLLFTKKFIKFILFSFTITLISLLLASNYSYAQISQISRQPYLQKASQHSMLIAWRSSNNANYELYYGNSPSSQPSLLTSSNATKHAISISGLDAYTQYYYKICDVGGSPCTNVEYFYTAKPDTELSTDILVFGDCGMNNTPQKNLAAKMLTASNNNDFDFGLVCGDVTQQDGTDYDTYYFDIYKDILKNRCYYTAIGNHDLYGYPADNGTAQQYLEDFYLFTNNPQSTEEYYSFEYGNAKIIALHVNFVNDYQPGSPQYEWLIDELECRTTEWVFVYFHQPPFTNAWDPLWYIPFQPYFQYDGEDDVRNNLVPVFETYDVDMVFNGHMHGYERGLLNGVQYVTSGGGGGNLDDSKPNNWAHISVQNFIHHYLIVNINGTNVDVTAIDENDNIVDNFTISKTTSTALVAAWNTTNICENDAPINLNTLLHPNATTGGVWTGSGVTANNFDPTGLSGNIALTYTLGTAPCTKDSTQNIIVNPAPDASWAANTTLCDGDPAISLNTLITTGLPNGTWTGTGVTGGNFDPTGLSGNVAVTYTVNSAGCTNTLTQNIMVETTPNVTWTTPTTPICDNDPSLNLMSLLNATATNSGNWTGTGVIGTSFNPAGLSGNIALTYSANTTNCSNNLTQNITVETAPNVTWTPPSSLCDTDPPLNLTTLLNASATNSGNWNGTGVTGSNFDPAGLSGNIAVTYAANGANCNNSSTQNIVVSNCAVIVKIKVLLQGSYDNATGLLSTDLRSNGTLPLAQPFNTSPWQYTGNESVSALSTIPATVSDWVLVELRDASNYNAIVAQRAAFLRNDGFVVDIDGVTNGVILPSLTTGGNYYLVIRSRNHLATMSTAPIALPNTTTYDFSTAINQAFGANQMVAVGSGVFAQYAGDFDGDGIVNVADFNVYDDELSNTGSYSPADGNMDNTVSIGDFNGYRPNASVIGVRVIRY